MTTGRINQVTYMPRSEAARLAGVNRKGRIGRTAYAHLPYTHTTILHHTAPLQQRSRGFISMNRARA
jgi:hypothetical protein